MKRIFEFFLDFLTKHRTAFVAAAFIIAAGMLYIQGKQNMTADADVYILGADLLESEASGETAPPTLPPETAPAAVSVYITGAVTNPGVYELASGSRVNDALAMAGGGTADADLTRVNLATLLADGMQITVPKTGEAAPAQNAAVSVTTSENPAPAWPLDINIAGEDALRGLPGIGTVTARAIIKYREDNGGFSKTEDLKKVSGIGEKTYEKIKDYVKVGG